MATNPIGGETAVVTRPNTFPPAAAGLIAAKLLDRHSPHEIAEAIEVLVDVLDFLGGDSEAESATWPENIAARTDETCLPDDSEAAGDELDTSWPEWQSRGRHKLAGGRAEMSGNAGHEDDEDADPDTGIEDSPEGFDPEEDMAVDDERCDGEGDDECEQMANDVPMLRVLSAAHNIFIDARVPLGLSNLQSSYRTDGDGVRSADSGVVHCSHGLVKQPGQPV